MEGKGGIGMGVGGSGVLLSNRYGIPTTKPKPTTAIKIMGFFKRLRGETVNICG